MKKIQILLVLFLLVSAAVFSQSYKIQWGEEIKLKKGTADLDIVYADNTGLFFSETRRKLTGFYVLATTYGTGVKLIKLDKNFGEVFDREYKKELKGLEYHSFQALENDLYMFASDYERKSKQFKILGAKVDKNTGDLSGSFMELGAYELDSRRDDYEMKVSQIQNGKAFLMVANISGKDKVTLGVSVLDKNFKKKENTLIEIPYNPDNYQLDDIKYSQSNKIVVLGREYEEMLTGKKKKKRMVFKQYVMSIYNMKGQKEKDITINSDNRYMISGKLVETNNGEMLLAGFYANDPKKEDLNGFFINKVDPDKGLMTLSSFKEINSGMLGKSYDDESDDNDEIKESKKQAQKARQNEEEEEFPSSFVIKSVDINPADNAIIISAEISKFSYYISTSTDYDFSSKRSVTTTTHHYRFINKDILVINADHNGNIKWINALPKSQLEEVRSTTGGITSGTSWADHAGRYFAQAGGMPFYSSYSRLIYNNKLVIIMNDHTSNNVNPEYGSKVKTLTNFRKKSNVYGISIDLATGAMTRKTISSNNEETILMPRHAFIVQNELYVPSWRIKLMAKTELKFAKITVK